MIHWVHAETGNILDLIRKVAKEKGRKEQQSTWALLERRAEVEYRAAGSRVACLSTRTSTRTLAPPLSVRVQLGGCAGRDEGDVRGDDIWSGVGLVRVLPSIAICRWCCQWQRCEIAVAALRDRDSPSMEGRVPTASPRPPNRSGRRGPCCCSSPRGPRDHPQAAARRPHEASGGAARAVVYGGETLVPPAGSDEDETYHTADEDFEDAESFRSVLRILRAHARSLV